MSKVQTKIPFKSRKLRLDARKLTTEKNDENLNSRNIGKTSRKRTNADTKTNGSCSEEECSPTKISRNERLQPKIQEISEDVRTSELPGREKELSELKSFLLTHLDRETSASLYISGQPGTGKTACLTRILHMPEFRESYKCVYVNCTMIKSAGNIYSRICEELKLKTRGNTDKCCLAAIEKYLTTKHKMTLLVLDEIDQLDSKKQSVLYTIFEWAGRADTRLVLVGIANALNLTERALPRLQGERLRPRLMHFEPYTREQIVDVFKKTIAAGGDGEIFTPAALQMLAAKVSALCGDMRRALELGRRVVELTKRDGANNNSSAQLQLVLSVLGDVYGGSGRADCELRGDTFPLQQKLAVCSLVLMLSKQNGNHVVLARLYDVYKRVAQSRNIAAVGRGEFASVCELLEARGVVRVLGREPRSARVALQWDRADVESALRDTALLSDILRDVRCLAPSTDRTRC